MTFEQKYLKYRKKYLELQQQLGGERNELIDALRLNGLLLQTVPDNLLSDIEVVITAVEQNGLALEFAPDNFKANKEVVMKALNQNGLALEFASENLRNDREIVLDAIHQLGPDTDEIDIFQHVSLELRNDYQFMLGVLGFNGEYYKYISDNLKNEKELLLVACQNNGNAIHYIPDHFINNRDVMIELIKINYGFFSKVSPELRDDNNFCELAILSNCNIYRLFSLEKVKDILISSRNTLELVKKLTIECDCNYYLMFKRYVPEIYNIDHYIEELVKKYDASYFDRAGDILKNDINFIKKICGINSIILYWIPDSVRDNEELFKGLWKMSKSSLLYASKRLRILLEQQLRDYIRTNIANFTLEDLFLQINHNITLDIYRNNDSLLQYLPRR